MYSQSRPSGRTSRLPNRAPRPVLHQRDKLRRIQLLRVHQRLKPGTVKAHHPNLAERPGASPSASVSPPARPRNDRKAAVSFDREAAASAGVAGVGPSREPVRARSIGFSLGVRLVALAVMRRRCQSVSAASAPWLARRARRLGLTHIHTSPAFDEFVRLSPWRREVAYVPSLR
jgi:hypothetical protein